MARLQVFWFIGDTMSNVSFYRVYLHLLTFSSNYIFKLHIHSLETFRNNVSCVHIF